MNPEEWIDAWLDGYSDKLTDDERSRLVAAAEAIEERYPVPSDGEPEDVADDRREALTAAFRIIVESDELENVVEEWQAANRAAQEAHARMTGAIIAEAQVTAKMTISRRTGLSRPTIDKALRAMDSNQEPKDHAGYGYGVA